MAEGDERIGAKVNAVGATPAASMRARSERASAERPTRARDAMRELNRKAETGDLVRIPSSRRRPEGAA
jgi:hypothetical protein